MKTKCYINGIGVVGPQGIWRKELWDETVEIQQGLAQATQPSYKELIPPAMIRRMSKAIKMGIFASQQALDEANMEYLDAIITGTGLGCLEDSEKFLRNVLDNDEEFLTPTSFIQSTHNTVAAQIALRLGCKGYNFTYVNGVVSFESALLDALLQIQTAEAKQILIGGIDEIYGHTFELKKLIQEIKADHIQETLVQSQSPGVNFGEGANFIALSNQLSDATYAEVVDVHFQNVLKNEDLSEFVDRFLAKNGLLKSDISVIVTGNNGDVTFDAIYTDFQFLFPDCPQVVYKNVSGHSDVASAFGLAAASYILKNQVIPEVLLWKAGKQSVFKNVLLYNQYLNKDHSLTLLRHVEA